MKAQTVWHLIGGGSIFIGLLTLLKIGDELYSGILSGSRSYGVNITNSPIGFFFDIALEAVFASFFIIVGISCIRFKVKSRIDGDNSKKIDHQ